jgi:uncharacterized phage-like protein YoqJ
MELQAVLDAVTSHDGTLDVVSDSTYVVNCFRDRWWEGWLRRGWTNSQRKAVANRDLWEPLIDAYRADPGRVAFRWVKGHSSDPMNDLVDRLAVEAAATQRGRSGIGQPDDLGPADQPGRSAVPAAGSGPASGARPGAFGAAAGGSSARSDPPGEGKSRPVSGAAGAAAGGVAAPSGHLLAVTGLRPAGLGGFGETLQAAEVRRRLSEILAAKAELFEDLVVLSGLGLGSEQLGAEAAAAAGVPYLAVLPYPDADRAWPAESRRHFAELLAGAKETITLDRRPPESKQKAGAALARRDGWLVAHADEAVVVWDDEDPFVGRTVRSFRDRLGEENVWVLEP